MSANETHGVPKEHSQNSVIVREYPKTVYLWPAMLFGIIFWILSVIINGFDLLATSETSSLYALFATLWLLIFTFNLLVISFDFSAGRTFSILITFFSIILLYIIIRDYFNFSITRIFPSFKQFLIDTGLCSLNA